MLRATRDTGRQHSADGALGNPGLPGILRRSPRAPQNTHALSDLSTVITARTSPRIKWPRINSNRYPWMVDARIDARDLCVRGDCGGERGRRWIPAWREIWG
jgi:hypothetical protein